MYSLRDDANKQTEHALLLKDIDAHKIIFLKRKETKTGMVYGSFFILNKFGQCIDITYNIAKIFDKDMVCLDGTFRVIDATYVETMIRDLSELLYGHWSEIELYKLE